MIPSNSVNSALVLILVLPFVLMLVGSLAWLLGHFLLGLFYE